MPFSAIHDNTTLRSVAAWADSSVDASQVDVANLLQLTSNIVLSDRILIPGFVHDVVAAHRDEGIDFIVRHGVASDLFEVVDEEIEVFKQRLARLGERVALKIAADPNAALRFFMGPRDITEREASHANDIHGLLFHPDRVKVFEGILEDPFGEFREFGAAGYTLASSSTLMRQLDEWRLKWTLPATQRLLDQLMLEKNHLFADDYRGAYAPNVKRAEIVEGSLAFTRRRLREELIAEIESQMGPFADEVPLPALARYLAHKSLGRPEKLLETALHLRELGAPLRAELAKADQALRSSNDLSPWLEVREAIREHAQALLSAQKSFLPKGISLSVSTTPPFIHAELDGRDYARGRRARRSSRDLTLISELVAPGLRLLEDDEGYLALLAGGRARG